jgi:hypothetical protein
MRVLTGDPETETVGAEINMAPTELVQVWGALPTNEIKMLICGFGLSLCLRISERGGQAKLCTFSTSAQGGGK